MLKHQQINDLQKSTLQVPAPSTLNDARTDSKIDTRLTQRGSRIVRGDAVYFIAGGGFIKIGVSNDPHGRLRDLQTSCPFDLKLLAYFPGDAKEELRIQGIFGLLHVRGEWFREHAEILDYIESRKRPRERRRNREMARLEDLKKGVTQ